MYLDAIIDEENEVVYNSIPENVRRWLLNRTNEEWAKYCVYDGERLRRWTVEEYLARNS